MVKTRIAPRFRIAKPARIEYDREKIDCVVRDLSATGSALEVANAGANSHWSCLRTDWAFHAASYGEEAFDWVWRSNGRHFDWHHSSRDRILAMFHSPAYLQGQTSPPSIVQAERFWTPNLMQLLASRDYPVIDYQTMGEFIGRERLFRATGGTFLLHMSSEGKLEAEEQIVWLTVRDAISWVNEAPDEFGSFWECAVEAPVEQKQTQHMSPAF